MCSVLCQFFLGERTRHYPFLSEFIRRSDKIQTDTSIKLTSTTKLNTPINATQSIKCRRWVTQMCYCSFTYTGCLEKKVRNGKNGCVTVKLIIHPCIIEQNIF